MASKRRSAFRRSPKRKVRLAEALRVNWAGPVMELRPALPHWSGGGRGVGGGVQVQSGGRGVEIGAGVVGADAAGDAGAAARARRRSA